ncbi:MAG TPA: hypothetical protein VH989_01170 [Actinomycetota bacterium]|jgi:hypothetical protein
MTERADDTLQADYPWVVEKNHPEQTLKRRAVELDQAVRHLQDLARGRTAASEQGRHKRRKRR